MVSYKNLNTYTNMPQLRFETSTCFYQEDVSKKNYLRNWTSSIRQCVLKQTQAEMVILEGRYDLFQFKGLSVTWEHLKIWIKGPSLSFLSPSSPTTLSKSSIRSWDCNIPFPRATYLSNGQIKQDFRYKIKWKNQQPTGNIPIHQ